MCSDLSGQTIKSSQLHLATTMQPRSPPLNAHNVMCLEPVETSSNKFSIAQDNVGTLSSIQNWAMKSQLECMRCSGLTPVHFSNALLHFVVKLLWLPDSVIVDSLPDVASQDWTTSGDCSAVACMLTTLQHTGAGCVELYAARRIYVTLHEWLHHAFHEGVFTLLGNNFHQFTHFTIMIVIWCFGRLCGAARCSLHCHDAHTCGVRGAGLSGSGLESAVLQGPWRSYSPAYPDPCW